MAFHRGLGIPGESGALVNIGSDNGLCVIVLEITD